MEIFTLFLIFFISLPLLGVYCQNAFNFVLQEFRWPKEFSNPKVQYFVRPRNFNPGNQLVDVNLSTPLSLGNDILAYGHLEVDTEMKKKESWFSLIRVEDDLCRFLELFLGQLFYDIERAAGIIPKSCPIPRGTYHAVNHTIYYSTLKLQTFPFGKIRVTGGVIKKSTGENLSGFVMLFLNKPLQN